MSRIPEELEFAPGLLEFLEERVVAARSRRHDHGVLTRRHDDGRDRRPHVGIGSFASTRILVTADS